MTFEELMAEISNRVVRGLEDEGRLLGVMEIQDKGDVALIRHAYVRTEAQKTGIGKADPGSGKLDKKARASRYLECCHMGDIFLSKKRIY